MYEVYCDNFKIYDSRLEKLKIFNAKLDLEVNKIGSFVFDIYPEHKYFDKLKKMKSIITIIQDGKLIFKGRILNTEEGFYNEQQVTCEGELAFLLDSIQRPYGSQANSWEGTPEEYLRMLIEGEEGHLGHNSQVDEYKQFKVGIVNVQAQATTGNIQRSDSEYKTTWELISSKLIDQLGGYLWVRHEADGNYIDYLKDFNTLSNQKIEFGKNLLNFKKITKGEDLMTGIIPLGAAQEETNTRITIAAVNDGLDYLVNTEAEETYGKIFKTVIWDDVNDPTTLKSKAQAYLANAIFMSVSIELSAADLSGIEGVNPFRIGQYIVVKDKQHGLETLKSDLEFLVKKLSLDILNPANNTLTVGATYKTFTETTTGNAKSQSEIVEKINSIEKNVSESGVTKEELNAAIAQVTEQNNSVISQSSTEILTQVSQDYYLKDDAEKLVESVETQFKQTNNEFQLRFNEFSQDIQSVANGADAQFQKISKYIRFVDGNILLGEDGNELILKIQNNKISFIEGNVEVAYFSNRKLYVNDGEYINSLKLGNYAFIPRTNGNLSFKKVT